MGLTINQGSFPQAAIELYDSGETGNNLWKTIVSPVLLAPNREHLAMVQAEKFDISQRELAEFCCELNLHFQEESLIFKGQQTERWYCFAEIPFEVAQVSPTTIIGENIFPYIPQGDNRRSWQKIFNDCQMLLHHSACNQQRINAGKPEINSLWFWGGGVLPDAYQSNFSQVMTNDSCVKNMGKLGGATSVPLELEHFSQTFAPKQGNLIYLDMLQFTEQQLKQLDENVIATLRQTVQDRGIEKLHIVIDNRYLFTVTRKSIRQFWKRKKSLAEFGFS